MKVKDLVVLILGVKEDNTVFQKGERGVGARKTETEPGQGLQALPCSTQRGCSGHVMGWLWGCFLWLRVEREIHFLLIIGSWAKLPQLGPSKSCPRSKLALEMCDQCLVWKGRDSHLPSPSPPTLAPSTHK